MKLFYQPNLDITQVLGPFVGSGTSLVACMENGLYCYGQDINPLAILAASTRIGPFRFGAIRKKKEILFKLIGNDSETKIESSFPGLRKWFKDGTAIEISKIVRAIRLEKSRSIRKFYWVILAETVRLSSNDRISTFKLHIRPQSEIEGQSLSAIVIFKCHYQNAYKKAKLHCFILIIVYFDSTRIEVYS